MATGAVLSAPFDAQSGQTFEEAKFPETRPELHAHAPAYGVRCRRSKLLRELVALVAFFAVLIAPFAWFPKTRSLAWNILLQSVLMLAVALLRYAREFHPSLLPSLLEYGSPLRVKLGRVKRVLGWTTVAVFVSGLAALGLSALSGTSCTCEDHPMLFVSWLAALGASAVGFAGVSGYLALRTIQPRAQTGTAHYWPRAPRPISEYKPFHSEHWGRMDTTATG